MEWISIKDRLPESNSVGILIYGSATCGTCDSYPQVREGRYRNELFEFGEYNCTCNVTHWMPLPPFPT